MGKSAEQIADEFNRRCFKSNIRASNRGTRLTTIVEIENHPKIGQIQVHPGGGRHEGAYLKISPQTEGIIKVVDRNTYKADKDEGAKILYHN